MKTFYKTWVVLNYALLIFNVGFAQAPNWAWAKSIGGTDNDVGNSIALDASGNVYTTGYFGGTPDFDPGAATFNLTSAGGNDIFISKLNASGSFVWAKAIGGTGHDSGISIAVDAAGNVYTTGFFNGTVDFNPGSGTFSLTSAGDGDIFISKLDSSGNFVWAKAMGGTNNDLANSIVLDSSGNIHTTGYFNGTADFDPDSSGNFNMTSAGNEDIFISKLDTYGNFVWAKAISGLSSELSFSIALDATGNVYTTGWFQGTADFDPGPGTFNLTSGGGTNIFISKLNASGNLIWAISFVGASGIVGKSIALDASGNVYTTGVFEGTVDYDPGTGTFNLTSSGYDIFISKLDSSGNFVWAKRMGGLITDEGSSIVLDASGNVYTTGWFFGTADFDPGVGTFNLTSAGIYDIFICKLDASGNFVWAKAIGGTTNDRGHSLAIDASGYLRVTGIYESSSIAFGSITLTNAGNNNPDIFIARLDKEITGIEESVQHNNGISFYPHPATTSCIITAPSFTYSTLVIYDITGRILLQQPFNEKATVNVAQLKAGMYVVEVRDKTGRSVKGKMVRE